MMLRKKFVKRFANVSIDDAFSIFEDLTLNNYKSIFENKIKKTKRNCP